MDNTSDTAVSPVVAVILMVAVTVILSAVVGAFVFNLGESTDDPQESIAVRFSETNAGVELQFITGSESTVSVRYHGEVIHRFSGVDAGKSVFVPTAPGDTVTIVTNKSVITSHTVDDTPALAGYWTMDSNDVSGNTISDRSGNSNTGQITGSPTTDASGQLGASFAFDTSKDNVTVARDSTLEPQTITFSAWAKSHTSTWNTNGWVLSKRDGDHEGYIIHPINSSSKIRIYLRGSDGNWHFLPYTPTDITKWHHYVGRYDGETLTFFVDGVPVGNTTPDVDIRYPDTNTSLYIGSDHLDSRQGDGQIDDVRIYNQALSDSEIKSLYRLEAE